MSLEDWANNGWLRRDETSREHDKPFILKPRGWNPIPPSEDEMDRAVSRVSREFFDRFQDVAKTRLFTKPVKDWQVAYAY